MANEAEFQSADLSAEEEDSRDSPAAAAACTVQTHGECAH